jgi:hypothetical protein
LVDLYTAAVEQMQAGISYTRSAGADGTDFAREAGDSHKITHRLSRE